MEEKGQTIKFDELIERYRWFIGSALLVAVIFSGGYLLWRESQNDLSNVPNAEQISGLEKRLRDSEYRIQQLEARPSQPSSNETTNQASSESSGQVAGVSAVSPSTPPAVTGKVNLNNATLAQLDTLPGIGPAYAQRIVDYRQSHGGFKNITELKNIKGIGEKTFEKLKELVSI